MDCRRCSGGHRLSAIAGPASSIASGCAWSWFGRLCQSVHSCLLCLFWKCRLRLLAFLLLLFFDTHRHFYWVFGRIDQIDSLKLFFIFPLNHSFF